MSEREKRAHSLSARMFNATLLTCMIVGVVAFIIGLGFYSYALSRQLVNKAYGAAHSAVISVEHGADSVGLSGKVMDIYRGLGEEERGRMGTDEYRVFFSGIEDEEDYKTLISILGEFSASSGVFDVYLGMFDRDTGALVYIADPETEPEYVCLPGDWEAVSQKEIERFLGGDGSGMLYDISNTEKYGWMCTAGSPVKDDAGRTIAFVLADVTLGNVLDGAKGFALQFFLAMIVIVALIVWVMSRRIKKKIVSPINSITDACSAYIGDREKGELSRGRFEALNIRTGDEIENLSLVMADMEHSLEGYVKDLTKVTAEKERINTELDLAYKIQTTILPNTFPPFPDRNEFDIFASMDPAKEVGGDFYDFFMIDDDHIGLVMADVSGKGIPAALFMMTSRTMLKDAALSGIGPARILEYVNARLSANNKYNMFVTVWMGILEISTGRLRWADAGHEEPIIFRNGKWSSLRKNSGTALGAFDPELLAASGRPAFTEQVLTMQPGDVILQYTDGVTEAMTAENKQFGTEQLIDTVRSAASTDPAVILPYIRGRIDSFVNGADQFDDITMMALRYNGRWNKRNTDK